MNSAVALDYFADLSHANSNKKKSMKRLTCRKCEGHGLSSVLKGHAASCPYNDCQCEACASVMSMRANALIRRFRHRQPGQNSAVLLRIRSKNGNMRLRILPKNANEHEMSGTTINYSEDAVSMSSDFGASSPLSAASSTQSPSPFNASPLGGVQNDVLQDYLNQILHASLLNQLLAANSLQTSLPPPPPPTETLSPLLLPMLWNQLPTVPFLSSI